ncbi:hypothetical protein QAD02_005386 [Eretmocerus hayati]|uniref:Uncharacterized protein n=1 Tax=Eretmocerus hayati TaxID=131215 RepID=A0ACC2NS82_9HYME|nr:hypothetical protein QAD02_005386 [Eretmocerus hayati]
MESASPQQRQQVKGCKANNNSSNSNHKGPSRQFIHSDSVRTKQQQQAMPNKQEGSSSNNGCDDEKNKEVPRSNRSNSSRRNSNGRRSTAKFVPLNTCTVTVKSNSNPHSPTHREKNRSNAAARSRSSVSTTRSVEPMSYSRALSAGDQVKPDLTSSPPVSPSHQPSSPAKTPEMSYSKAVSSKSTSTDDVAQCNGSTTSSPSTPVPGSELTYSKVVSGGTTGKLGAIERAKPKTPEQPEAHQRHAVLSYDQVLRLNDVMNEVVSIHGRGNFPTIEVRLRDLVVLVRSKLEHVEENDENSNEAEKTKCITRVRDIRLNGGAASHVLATECQAYNDLDLIYGVELENAKDYERVKQAVLDSLFELLPEGVSRARITACSLKEAYVSKMVKVQSADGSDRWSLISLGNSRGHRNVELKFVHAMRRQFEFSVDSFQIVLDSLLRFHETSRLPMTESVYPTVVGESVYGDFHEALYHLQNKLISTRHPEEIRGGGLLKYCNLLVKAYKPAQPDYIKSLERYMCSRFFIDFPDIGQQKAKLENYLWNHFVGAEEECLKYQYLSLLHGVVEESTVCLMGHERRQTLALIESLAYQVLAYQEQQQQRTLQIAPSHHQQQQTAMAAAPPATTTAYVYANGYYYATSVIPTTAAAAAACYTCTCNPHWMAACSS